MIRIDSTQLLSKIPFLLFSAAMILFYYTGLAFPEETNFWLVSYGFPILMLEFLGICVIVLLLSIINKENQKRMPILGLIVIMLMAFAFTALFNIILYLYFLISTGIKYVAFKKFRTLQRLPNELELSV